MAQTIVDLTLETIRDLLVEEVKFLSGVRYQVKDVQKELKRMQSFMEDIDRRKYEEAGVLNFFKEIRVLCYQIEDVVDTYAAKVAHKRREKGIINILKRISCALCQWISIHEVGTDVASIKTDISNLTASMDAYGIIKIPLESQKSDEADGRKRERSDEGDGGNRWSRRTYGLGVDNDFVGKEKDIKLLVLELLNGASRHRVVSIWGMGGLGKTTLAEKIYHDNDIRKEYEAFAWVCVSKNCEPRNIFQDLLQQLSLRSNHETNDMGDNIFVQEVCKVLQKQKCLVVLDDIWEAKDWGCLSPAFKVAGTNSKVLITTRKRSVAEIGFFHPLDVLSQDEAWELLQKKAFATTDPQGNHRLSIFFGVNFDSCQEICCISQSSFPSFRSE